MQICLLVISRASTIDISCLFICSSEISVYKVSNVGWLLYKKDRTASMTFCTNVTILRDFFLSFFHFEVKKVGSQNQPCPTYSMNSIKTFDDVIIRAHSVFLSDEFKIFVHKKKQHKPNGPSNMRAFSRPHTAFLFQ